MTQTLILSLLLAALAVMLWYKAARRPRGALLAAALFLLVVLLSGAYLVADSLSGAGIDESVIFHLKAGVTGAAFSDFETQFLMGGGFVVGGLLAAGLVYRLARGKGVAPHRVRVFFALLAFGAAIAINPASRDLAFLYRQTLFQSQDLPEGFIMLTALPRAARPKNFVILYLEQIERTYFDESVFPGLMPNLKALEKQAVSFTDITQARDTSWSIAGMTAGFCGVPLVGAAATNSMSGIDQFMPGATCLGDLLKPRGYRLEHLYGGDLDFAGWGTFFRTHGFDQVDGLEALEPLLPEGTPLGPWGLHDENLLTFASQRYADLASTGQPFGMTLNTIDTHSPFGQPGPYCDGITYGDGENTLLNTLHCADRMLAQFITDIRSNPAFADTVLVVASDHLAMPNTIWEQLESADKRRNLLMIFDTDTPPALIDKTGSSFDVGTTLLNVMGYPVEGLGFGRNLLADTPSLITATPPLDDLILQSSGFLTSLWSYPQLENGVVVDIPARKLQLGNRQVSFPVLFTLDAELGVNEANFDFYDGYPLPEKAANLWPDQRFFWVDTCAHIRGIAFAPPADTAEFCMAEGMLGNADIKAAPVSDAEEIPFAEISAFLAPLTADDTTYQTRLANIAQFSTFGVINAEEVNPGPPLTGTYIIRSKGGYALGESVLENVDTGEEITFERGLTLLGLNSDAAPETLAYVDTCAYETPVEDLPPLTTDFASVMAENQAAYGAFMIVLHDSALCSRYEIAPLFADTGLERWREIGPRSSYIGLVAGNGEISEFVGPRETALTVAAQNFIRP